MGGDSRFKLVGFGFLIFVIGLAFILFVRQFNPPIPLTNQQKSPPPPIRPKQTNDLTVTLRPISNSRESGSVHFMTIDGGKTAVEINVANENAISTTSAQPVYIRTGVCKEPGEIVTTLNRLTNGHSRTELTETIDEWLKKEGLIITVHKPITDTFAVTSCGELKKS